MLRMASSAFDKRERRRGDFPKMVIREVLESSPELLDTMDIRILAEEVSWGGSGYPMYFTESAGLVGMLWRSKVNVRVEDLELDRMPRAFAISWPKCEIDGVQPVGCLIWWGDGDEWMEANNRMLKEYVRPEILKMIPASYLNGKGMADNRLGIHMSFCREDEMAKKMGAGDNSYYRVSAPHDLLEVGLSSQDNFEATFSMKLGGSNVIGLSAEEIHIQYVTLKLALRLLVYMRACPEYVHSGYPGGKNRRAYEGRWDEFSPKVVGAPERLMMGTHESPIAHMRNWHFRSYPTKADGTKRKGVVFVNATVVNADADIDPITVGDGGKDGDVIG